MTAYVKTSKQFGLQTFKVYVNGVVVTEALSQAGALSYLKTRWPQIKILPRGSK